METLGKELVTGPHHHYNNRRNTNTTPANAGCQMTTPRSIPGFLCSKLVLEEVWAIIAAHLKSPHFVLPTFSSPEVVQCI
jgi:hypothetical protein